MEELNYIQRALQRGYTLNIGNYFSEGGRIFSKNIVGFAGYGLLLSVITVLIGMIPCVSTLFMLGVLPMLQIGYAIVADLIHRDKEYTFNDFFSGFSRYGDLFLTNLLTIIFAALACIPGIIVVAIGAAGLSEELQGLSGIDEVIPMLAGSGTFIVGILLLLAGVLVVMMSFMLAPQLVYFHRMDAWPAMMTGMKLVNKRWINWFLFLILLGIVMAVPALLNLGNTIDLFRSSMARAGSGESTDISFLLDSIFSLGQLGSIAVGALVQPFIHCTFYAAFAGVTGLKNDGSHFIEDHFAVNE